MKRDCKQKRALVTAWSLNEYGGAGLNCFELAEELRRRGFEVDFFTYQKNIGPLSKHIEQLGYRIYSDRFYILKAEDEQAFVDISISDYDYLFIVENIMPITLIKQLESVEVLPKIITLYMSELVGHPTDTPLSKVLNEKIADLNLTISNKAKKDIMYRILDESVPVDLYRNPAPVEFSRLPDRTGELKNIAVIYSSGAGSEIVEIGEVFKDKNIQIDYIGAQFNNVRNVDASFYDQYDLIVGIGKNVQYCLVSGVPVYIYGRFGGPGYLDDRLYDKIIREGVADNFSGRHYGGFRTSGEITEEILSGYKDALSFHKKNRKKFIQEYSIDKVVEGILSKVDSMPPKKSNLSEKEVNWLVSFQILIDLYWHARERNIKKIDNLERQVTTKDRKIKQISDEFAEYLSIKRSARLLVGNIKRRVLYGKNR